MTFIIIDEFERTEALADTLYEISFENPRNAQNACSPTPYLARGEIDQMFESRHPIVLAVEAIDDEILVAGAVQFNQESGLMLKVIEKYYKDGAGNYTPKTYELMAALVAGVKSRSDSGRAVSQSRNPNTRAVSLGLGMEFDD